MVILTEGTGDAQKGALGIYRGQRGRMQIEVAVTGRSCHGSMPWEGLNPLEHGGAIIAEAARRYEARDGFLDHPFLGHGTRTASWATLDTPSDCAVPERFTFRFDRRLTVGETPEQALRRRRGARRACARPARRACASTSRCRAIASRPGAATSPTTRRSTRAGSRPRTTRRSCARRSRPTAASSRRTSSSPRAARAAAPCAPSRRVDRWIFSTDGVGFPVPVGDDAIRVPEPKRWVVSGDVKHPAMFGIGAGIEQNTHRIGECVDLRELQHAIAVLARFPSLFAAAA